MPQQRLDGDKVNTPLVVVCCAGPPHGMGAEPFALRPSLQLHHPPQPVPDGPSVQLAPGFVGKEHRGLREPPTDVVQIPPQHQIESIEHRHPAWPRPRSMRPLAEAHVQFSERPAVEMRVPEIKPGHLVRPQPGMIKRSEERIVPGRRGILAGRANALPHEGKEDLHAFHAWRGQQRRSFVADVPRGVEFINRAYQPDPERGLDLGGLARLQEPVEALERLDVAPPRGGGQTLHGQVTHHAVNVFVLGFPGGAADQREHPSQHPGLVLDRHEAESAGDPRTLVGVDAIGLELLRIHTDRWHPGIWLMTRDDPKIAPVHGDAFFAAKEIRYCLSNISRTEITTLRAIVLSCPDHGSISSKGTWTTFRCLGRDSRRHDLRRPQCPTGSCTATWSRTWTGESYRLRAQQNAAEQLRAATTGTRTGVLP